MPTLEPIVNQEPKEQIVREFNKKEVIQIIKEAIAQKVIDIPDIVTPADVLEDLKGQDINVNGITSKGIANTGGLANIGNVAVSGNIEATGYIKAGAYELDEDITITNTPTDLECTYAHARISNGKLNLVLAFKAAPDKTIPSTQAQEIGSIVLPESVLEKLVPFISTYLCTDIKYIASASYDGNSLVASKPIVIRLSKGSTSVRIFLSCESFNTLIGITGDCRFEFNFIL